MRTQGSISIQRHMQMLLSGIKGSQFHYTIYTTIQPISNWEGPEAMAYPIQLSPFRIWPFFCFLQTYHLQAPCRKTGVTTRSDKPMFNVSTVNTECSRLPFSQQKVDDGGHTHEVRWGLLFNWTKESAAELCSVRAGTRDWTGGLQMSIYFNISSVWRSPNWAIPADKCRLADAARRPYSSLTFINR